MAANDGGRQLLRCAAVTDIARFALRQRTATLALLLLTTLVLAAGIGRLRTDGGYRAFLGTTHPTIVRFDAFLSRFDGGLPLAAVWRCADGAPCDSIFDDEALQMADNVASELAALPSVARVESPASTVILTPTPAGPVARHLMEAGELAPDREALAKTALRDPAWLGQLVSEDARTGAIVAHLTSSDSDVAERAYRALDRALAPYEAHGFVFHRVGGPVEFVVAGAELEAAVARLIPVMVALVGAVLVVVFRSFTAAALSLASVGIAVLWTMGFMGWMGWPQNSVTQTLPPLILAIGVCDGIHLIARYAARSSDRAATDGATRRTLVLAAARDVARPCLLTSLTTAAGFASFAGADLEAFARFGTVAAFGMMAALLLTFTALPIGLAALPAGRIRSRPESDRWERALRALLGQSRRHARSIAALAGAGVVLGGIGMSALRVDASFEELYGEHSRVVQWARFVADHLQRPDTLEVELELAPGTELADPDSIEVIDKLGLELAAIDGLGPARSLVGALDHFRAIALPPDQAAAARGDIQQNQALLGLIAGLGGSPEHDALRPWRDSEGRHVRISVQAEKLPQGEMREAVARIRGTGGIFDTEVPRQWRAEATGPMVVVHDMIDAIRSAQLESFAIAGLAVLALVALFLRSPASAALAAIPTLLPVVATLGIMGALGIALDVGSSMVAAVVLGIAVDDAIYILDHWRLRLEAGDQSQVAIEAAVLHSGRAIVTTSLALATGFAVLGLSPWASVASFGRISAIAIAAALAATLVVLPALLMLASDRGSAEGSRH